MNLAFSSIMQLRKENQDAFTKRHGLKLGFMSAFVKASAYALTQSPTVNAVIDGTDIVYRDYVDISVAVATPKVCLLKFLYSEKAGKMSNITLFYFERRSVT